MSSRINRRVVEENEMIEEYGMQSQRASMLFLK